MARAKFGRKLLRNEMPYSEVDNNKNFTPTSQLPELTDCSSESAPEVDLILKLIAISCI